MSAEPAVTDQVQAATSLDEAAERRARPVVAWLLEERLKIGRTAFLFARFCERLREIDLPVDRATIHMPQLHPQLAARSLLWLRETSSAVETGHRHADQTSAFYLRSPVRHVFEGGAEIRHRIMDTDPPDPYPIIAELRGQGYTDYLMLPLAFSTGRTNAVGFATKAPAGFDDLDIATLKVALPAFGAVMELNHLHRTARTLLDTYVGRDSGDRILNGAVLRGAGEEIHAVVWYCDLRDFTHMSQGENLGPVIALLNDYFECMAQPVQAHGGEILKFMGDGMLAIFPCEATAAAKCKAADNAIAAAEGALEAINEVNRKRTADGASPLRVGIAIAVGKVMYGNVGAADRLDFTVIGPVVNLVSRLEPLSARVEPPIVVSESLARASRRTYRPLGRFALKGLEGEVAAFALAG